MSVIDEIKQKLDIVDLVRQYVPLQESGRNFRALCPFHSEKTPSFFVFPEKQSWHCFGACGIGGDIYSFIMKKEGLDFGQTLRFLAEKAGVVLVNQELQTDEETNKKAKLVQINEAIAAYYHHLLLNTSPGKIALDYLSKREISSQTMKDFELGYSKDSFDDAKKHLLNEGFSETELLEAGLILKREDEGTYDRFRNRLMFPIRDIKGQVIGFGARSLDDSLPKYLNSPQTLVFDKSSNLYAIDRAKESIRRKNEVVIMEGYMDVLTAHQHGWNNSIASMGTALTDKQLSILKKLTKNIILALDSDVAGEKGNARAIERIGADNFTNVLKTDDINAIFSATLRVAIPSQSKDPDEEIRKNPVLWATALKEAKSIMDFLIDNAKIQFESANIKDKALIVESLLPLIGSIENSLIRGQYIQKFAHVFKFKENDIRDRVTKIKIDERKRRTNKDVSFIKPKSVLLSINSAEEYCLKLLLQCPSLRTEGMKLSPDLFEFSETKEILLKWQKCEDANSLKLSLDSSLYSFLDSLLNSINDPNILVDEIKQKKCLNDCTIRLQEKMLKNLEAKKAELLSTQASFGGRESELALLKEQGIEPSKQLKHIFDEQSRRHKAKL
jgi:DNA primase